jgi:hypothetical protein
MYRFCNFNSRGSVCKDNVQCSCSRAADSDIDIGIVRALEGFCKRASRCIKGYPAGLCCNRATALVERTNEICIRLSRCPSSAINSAAPAESIRRCDRSDGCVRSNSIFNINESNRVVSETCYSIFKNYKYAIINIARIEYTRVPVRTCSVTIGYCYNSIADIQFYIARRKEGI